MTEWQPIETAPKEQNDIILACFNEKWADGAAVMVGFWNGKCFASQMGYEDKDSTCITMFTCDWTHWMPLPSPPKAEASE